LEVPLPDLTADQIMMLVILLAAFVLLITEFIRNDVVGVLIIIALYASGLLNAKDALSGFGSEPAIVVAGIFVLSAALHLTGVTDIIGVGIGRLAGGSLTRAISVLMPAIAVLSAFTHHVTTTAIMVPVALRLGADRNIPASKLLMPVSFAASLGTTITIIGAPAFIIASEILERAGGNGLGIFSIAPIGLALSILGTLFMLTIGRWLLPSHTGSSDQANRFRLENYVTELRILPNSRYVEKTLEEVHSKTEEFSVHGWFRNGRHLGEKPSEKIQANDVLLIQTSPEEIAVIRQDPGVEINPIAEYGQQASSENPTEIHEMLVQVVLAPGSDLIGRTLGEIDFRRRYGAIVIGLRRQTGWLREQLSKIRLRAGDVLVLEGEEEVLDRVAADSAFLLMAPFQAQPRVRAKGPLASLIMIATVLAAAFEILSIEMAALAGAAAVVLTRCLSPSQAYRAIDTRVFVFIAGAIPLGEAMERSGVSKVLASWTLSGISDWSPFWVLALLFGIVAVLTQFMSDSATTALFAPVAVSLARGMGHSPEAYVVTVAVASVASFLTPIGHHGNLLIYHPGRYRFVDFLKVGTPLTILAGLTVCLLAPMLWPVK